MVGRNSSRNKKGWENKEGAKPLLVLLEVGTGEEAASCEVEAAKAKKAEREQGEVTSDHTFKPKTRPGGRPSL